ncbi:hypothetical protein SAY86_023089 [Trapa natans]|uniref:Myb-like domain-containing protein n=1 Tax=Trapa natans TaxID=22666 RepID=A0AAN7LVA1_TRANT|nr:hypothetical protein SAY86_023089 [Trapa natans]
MQLFKKPLKSTANHSIFLSPLISCTDEEMMEDLLLDQAQEAHVSDAKWFILDEEVKQLAWTSSENKMFERALAVHDEDNPDRWHRVAALIPGKTVADVSNIEAGLVPAPG